MTLKKIQDLAAKKKAFEKELDSKAEKALESAFDEFFKNHPQIQAISFAGHTPSFNDGDACEFGIGDLSVYIGVPLTSDQLDELEAEPGDNEVMYRAGQQIECYEEDDDDDDDPDEDSKEDKSTPTPLSGYWKNVYNMLDVPDGTKNNTLKAAQKDLQALWKEVFNDLILAAYGDNICVVMTPNEVRTSTYNTY